MSYNPTFLANIKVINTKIDSGEIEGAGNAIDLFDSYLSQIVTLGQFSPTEWDPEWRKEVYKFGEKFDEASPDRFLTLIQNKQNTANSNQQEVLDFHKCEIEFNHFPKDEYKLEINKLIQRYPLNPEFRHTFGHYLKGEGKILESIEQYEFAIKKDPSYTLFKDSLFNAHYAYIENLISSSKYTDGINHCNKLITEKVFKNSFVFNNILIGLHSRLNDIVAIDEKILGAEESFKETIRKETDKERRRLIEILGFFSAIIAFIFSTVSIGKNFKFDEAIVFVVCLGITLIIFVMAISIIFNSEKTSLFSIKFLTTIVLILALLLVLFSSQSIF